MSEHILSEFSFFSEKIDDYFWAWHKKQKFQKLCRNRFEGLQAPNDDLYDELHLSAHVQVINTYV